MPVYVIEVRAREFNQLIEMRVQITVVVGLEYQPRRDAVDFGNYHERGVVQELRW